MSDLRAYSIKTEQITIAPGATLAHFYEPIAGQINSLIKYLSGGTLQICGVTLGMTMTAAQLVSADGQGYLMGATEALSLEGPAPCYLMALSATTMVTVVRGKSAGT
jgi:hypothetical protein